MRLLTVALLAVLLTACSNVDVGIPDPTTTGQLVVAYDANQQGMALLPGACSEPANYDEQVSQGVEGVEARAYYGLKPGAYCLRYGALTGENEFVLQGVVPLDVQAGALDFVSIVPIPTEPAP